MRIVRYNGPKASGKYWITIPDPLPEGPVRMGPYDTLAEAREARKGCERFYAFEADEPDRTRTST